MPDPAWFGLAAVASATAAAVTVRVGSRFRLTRTADRGLVSACGLVVGCLCGWYVFGLVPSWPPSNALGRFIAVVLPAAVVAECFAVTGNRWQLATVARLVLALLAPRILLHGSVYLNENSAGDGLSWLHSTGTAIWALAAIMSCANWLSLVGLGRRIPGARIPVAVACTLIVAGVVTAFEGYVSGGEAAMTTAFALIGIALPFGVDERNRPSRVIADFEGAIRFAIVVLCGLVFVGRFFGGLSNGQALVLLISPQLGWLTQLRFSGSSAPCAANDSVWRKVLFWVVVLLPLLWLVIQAKAEFDAKMGSRLHAGIHPDGLVRWRTSWGLWLRTQNFVDRDRHLTIQASSIVGRS